MLEGGASHTLEIEIAKVEVEGSPCVFVGEIDPRDAFIVGGESDWNSGRTIGGEWMPLLLNAEDNVVRGEVDFSHDVAGGHLF